MWRKMIAQPWVRKAAAICLTASAGLLFLFNMRRQGERASRAAERQKDLKQISHAPTPHKMPDAAANRPRSRNDLVDRLRKDGL